MKKYLVILFIMLMAQSVYAVEKELDQEMIVAINQVRMTTVEKKKVAAYIKKFNRKTKDKLDIEILMMAIEKLSAAKYEAMKHNPSDVIAGKADCQGYSILLHMLLASNNIECRVVYDDRHMWNMVRLNNEYIAVDVTAMVKWMNFKGGV